MRTSDWKHKYRPVANDQDWINIGAKPAGSILSEVAKASTLGVSDLLSVLPTVSSGKAKPNCFQLSGEYYSRYMKNPFKIS